MPPDLPTDPGELRVIALEMAEVIDSLLRENIRLRAMVSAGYARRRPATVDTTPIRRQEDVP